jgi:hypothetical protein
MADKGKGSGGILSTLSLLGGFGSSPDIGGKYDKKDAAADTGASVKEVSDAHHQARNDCAGFWGVPANRHGKK